MGRACLVLAGMLLAIFLFPENLVHGASLDKPTLAKPSARSRNAGLENHIRMMGQDRGDNERDSDERDEYDYDFMNHPPYGGGFPRDLRAMQRHERMMKRLRRDAMMNGQSPFDSME